MLQPFDSYRLKPTIAIPEHLDEFAKVSTELLREAHLNTLSIDLASVRIAQDDQARRVYIESQHENPFERERLAIHLGKASNWLMVHFHRPVQQDARSTLSYPKSTVVLQDAASKIHTADSLHLGPVTSLEDNETAAKFVTNRLHESIGYFGLGYLLERDQFKQVS